MSAVVSDGKTAALLTPNQASPTDRFAVGRDGGAWTGAAERASSGGMWSIIMDPGRRRVDAPTFPSSENS